MARKGIPVLDFDDLIIAIQALSAPSATDVAVDPTGMEIITANNSQGALKQLDTAVDSVKSSLTQYITISNVLLSSSETFSANEIKELTASATLTGYLPRCVVGFAKSGAGHAQVIPTEWRISSQGSAIVSFKNTDTSSRTITSVYAIVLFTKDMS